MTKIDKRTTEHKPRYPWKTCATRPCKGCGVSIENKPGKYRCLPCHWKHEEELAAQQPRIVVRSSQLSDEED